MLDYGFRSGAEDIRTKIMAGDFQIDVLISMESWIFRRLDLDIQVTNTGKSRWKVWLENLSDKLRSVRGFAGYSALLL